MKVKVEITDNDGNVKQYTVENSLPADEHLKFAEWCISNGVTTYYDENSAVKYIDDSKELFFDILQLYDKFKRQLAAGR